MQQELRKLLGPAIHLEWAELREDLEDEYAFRYAVGDPEPFQCAHFATNDEIKGATLKDFKSKLYDHMFRYHIGQAGYARASQPSASDTRPGSAGGPRPATPAP